MRILHVIDRIGPGGPIRSLLAAIACAGPPRARHRLLALTRPTYMPLAFKARRLGLDVAYGAGVDATRRAMAEADVVLVHWWSTPALWDLLGGPLPAVPIVLWSKVAGRHVPQLVTATLLDRIDRAVFTAPAQPELVAHPAAAPEIVVPGLVEPERLEPSAAEPHADPVVACVGTLHAGKMHPRLIELLAAIDAPRLRFLLVGGLDAATRAQIARARSPERFVDVGFREDVPQLLAGADLFAYPLAPSGYASSDKALQEAMLQGVTPAVLAGTQPARFVRDGETGIVAQTAEEFVARCTRLLADPAERVRLGANARAWARAALDPEPAARRLWETVAAAAGAPCSARDALSVWRRAGERGAGLAAVALGLPPAVVAARLDCDPAGLAAWSATLPTAAFEVEGGLVHFSEHWPDDPILRGWVERWAAKRRQIGASDP